MASQTPSPVQPYFVRAAAAAAHKSAELQVQVVMAVAAQEPLVMEPQEPQTLAVAAVAVHMANREQITEVV